MSWSAPLAVADLCTADIARPDIVFVHNGVHYRTIGERLSAGGMGNVFLLERHAPGEGMTQAVAKVFHHEFLYQLRTDEVTKADHEMVVRNIGRIAALDHENLLPTFLSEDIRDNHLTVTPQKHSTLFQVITQKSLQPRHRVQLLISALRGLSKLHQHRLIHRDVTLRNILVNEAATTAYLFDFDLTLDLDDVVGQTYEARYKGRLFGSPGYSVPPEVLDTALMRSAITTKLDVYAIGGALFGLFTDKLPYGDAGDMWGLLLRISEGIVFSGTSHVQYPDDVPDVVRPIIDGCLERDPGNRYGSVDLIITELEHALPHLEVSASKVVVNPMLSTTSADSPTRIDAVHAARVDDSITKAVIQIVDNAMVRYGYHLQHAVGRVRGFPIFLVAPDPQLVAEGRFSDTNTYPKIVTAININGMPDREQFVDLWLGGYLPILREARQGLSTALYRVLYDDFHGWLFLFSEYVQDARFGSDLDRHSLNLVEALGLSYLVGRQIRRLHNRGLAHNNVSANALLFKAGEQTAMPAMVGLVCPTFGEESCVTDVRRLAALAMTWIRDERVAQLETSMRAQVDECRSKLAAMAFDERVRPPSIRQFMQVVSGGLGAVDSNFALLAAHTGDLESYVLDLIQHSLYNRLWG